MWIIMKINIEITFNFTIQWQLLPIIQLSYYGYIFLKNCDYSTVLFCILLSHLSAYFVHFPMLLNVLWNITISACRYAIMYLEVVVVLRCVQLFVTSWTVAHQAPLPMGVSRQEYQSGVPLPSLARHLKFSQIDLSWPRHPLPPVSYPGDVRNWRHVYGGGSR